jgi:hypothetical protein
VVDIDPKPVPMKVVRHRTGPKLGCVDQGGSLADEVVDLGRQVIVVRQCFLLCR